MGIDQPRQEKHLPWSRSPHEAEHERPATPDSRRRLPTTRTPPFSMAGRITGRTNRARIRTAGVQNWMLGNREQAWRGTGAVEPERVSRS